ncbi:MAG: hypothetical protein JWR84_1552 [Caulobacter sp.]|nr:hypothetical protein [Caulobacter sp.]
MELHALALTAAGIVGGATAVIHGVLTQKLMVRPVGVLAVEGRLSLTIRRIVPMLLQYSTFSWLLCGLALVWAAGQGAEVRLAVGLLAGGQYLFAAVGNAWGTRGKHPGWMLMAVAVGLIEYGVSGG